MSDREQEFLPPSLGRRKRHSQAALPTRGDGWSALADEWGYHGVGPTDGPDVLIHEDADTGGLWDDLTRARW